MRGKTRRPGAQRALRRPRADALEARALVNRRCSAWSPPRPLAHDRRRARTSAGAARERRALKDLIVNFNTTAGAFAGQRTRKLRAAVGLLGPTLTTANAAFSASTPPFPPTRAFAREILPGVRETAATIDAAFPWIAQTRALLAPAELQGLVARARARPRATWRG